jgi:RNA polymerase sigma-70 factor (ECF subfamily)
VRTSPRTLENTVTQLFEEFRAPLYRYLVLIIWNPGEAEDLVQEVFVRLLGQLNDGKSIDNLRAWLFRVGHNLAANRLRSERKSDSLSEDHIHRDVENRLASAVPNPEALILRPGSGF